MVSFPVEELTAIGLLWEQQSVVVSLVSVDEPFISVGAPFLLDASLSLLDSLQE